MFRPLVLMLAMIAGCGGSGVDNGAPSTNYPAPHPPLPQVINVSNGPVLTSPNAYLVFYADDANEDGLKTFATNMAKATYWGTVTGEYGVGPLSYKGAIDITDTPPTNIAQDDLRTWVGTELTSGAFGTPDPQGIYTIVFPNTTTITQPNPVSSVLGMPQSCVDFIAYHDAVVIGAATYAFAVIPTCGALPSLTDAISHEWVEAATDPQIVFAMGLTGGGAHSAFFFPDLDHRVWALLGGGEVGDMCEPEGELEVAPTDIGQPVQRIWSNKSAAAGHDPCVPVPAGAFFDSVPVVTDTLNANSTFTGAFTTKGLQFRLGTSRTIEVDLFSDGDTNGPWMVEADDVVAKYYGAYGFSDSMTFAWDRTSGVNGEKLHLTITLTQSSLFSGAHVFEIVSTQGSRMTTWPVLVLEE